MAVVEIAPGLHRWTAPHPEWDPDARVGCSGDWPREVGCVLYAQPETVTLFDPLLPRDGRAGFLDWMDEVVGGRHVSVLTTIRWHRRDREEIAERYRANRTRAWNAIPSGVTPKPLRGAGETTYWLGGVATLIVGDRLIGTCAGEIALCPQSWLEQATVDRAGLARLMRPLLELPIERVLVSHGEPVLHGGRAALARAIAQGLRP